MKLFKRTIISKIESKNILNKIVCDGIIKYSIFTKEMSIELQYCYVRLSLIDGKGEYYDTDFDGCGQDHSYSFKVIRNKDNKLKIKKI